MLDEGRFASFKLKAPGLKLSIFTLLGGDTSVIYDCFSFGALSAIPGSAMM
jgi:hypothetical protein